MRMVIDSNILQDNALQEYLSKSRKNAVVVTDYVMIEALKGDTPRKIFDLLKILTANPNKVVVLKSMRSTAALKGRRCGITRRMIDAGLTRGFADWCVGLSKAKAGDKEYLRQLGEAGEEATAQIERIRADQGNYAKAIEDEAKNYTQNEIRIIRTDQPYSPEIVSKMAERIVGLTIKFFELHPDGIRPPTILELPYTFLFRMAVCAYLQTLRRIRDGGAQGVTADKIANDIVDATYVVYASFFQGLLSKDAKANELYRNVKHVLKALPPGFRTQSVN
jgi:hypothetical protein